ncbi:hypothetical protein AVEN_149632-1 [Araneus ventricosus]|uniref:Uncharacterized protein n=1 Tax=Araneus ventricosus TaxID=182803 RepID=A0A4Y2UDT3_ARAVE|nr:hypothetical protein AVEN_149632-1 [Araneus ventricosus]
MFWLASGTIKKNRATPPHPAESSGQNLNDSRCSSGTGRCPSSQFFFFFSGGSTLPEEVRITGGRFASQPLLKQVPVYLSGSLILRCRRIGFGVYSSQSLDNALLSFGGILPPVAYRHSVLEQSTIVTLRALIQANRRHSSAHPSTV